MRHLIFLVSGLLLAASVSAQRPFHRARAGMFNQQVPPFLRPAAPRADATVLSLSPRFTARPSAPKKDRLNGFLDDYLAVFGFNNQAQLGYPYLETFADTPNPQPLLRGLRGPAPRFDYRQTQPHLAFFCRLEINEARRNVVPFRFRLGGNRFWQESRVGW